ncbi:MAG: LamG domain-containing protein [Planctomycetota bacterium]|jgi:hypothetical protein
MKQALMMIVVVQLGVFLGGCESGADKPVPSSPGDNSQRKIIEPTAADEDVKEPDTSRGLVGWWKFDEVSGKTAADSSGHGRNGVLQGDLSFDNNSMEGRAGRAVKLEAEDDYIEITGYKGITGTAPRTVAAWIKTEQDNGLILSWGRDEGGSMFNFGFVPGRRRIGVTPEGGYLYMKDNAADNKWHHVAAVVEEAELPNLHDHVKLFLDGDAAVIHDIGVLDLYPIETGSELDVSIGKGFRGALDDVRLYDRPLTEQEIELLFSGQ